MSQQALPLPVVTGQPIEIVLPFLPKSRNQLAQMPWLHRRGYAEKWWNHLSRAVEGIGQYQSVTVEMELWFGSNRTRDWQNYVGPIGVLANALVRGGVIPDDAPANFQVGPNAGITFMVDSNRLVPLKDRQRTVFRITPEE